MINWCFVVFIGILIGVFSLVLFFLYFFFWIVFIFFFVIFSFFKFINYLFIGFLSVIWCFVNFCSYFFCICTVFFFILFDFIIWSISSLFWFFILFLWWLLLKCCLDFINDFLEVFKYFFFFCNDFGIRSFKFFSFFFGYFVNIVIFCINFGISYNLYLFVWIFINLSKFLFFCFYYNYVFWLRNIYIYFFWRHLPIYSMIMAVVSSWVIVSWTFFKFMVNIFDGIFFFFFSICSTIYDFIFYSPVSAVLLKVQNVLHIFSQNIGLFEVIYYNIGRLFSFFLSFFSYKIRVVEGGNVVLSENKNFWLLRIFNYIEENVLMIIVLFFDLIERTFKYLYMFGVLFVDIVYEFVLLYSWFGENLLSSILNWNDIEYYIAVTVANQKREKTRSIVFFRFFRLLYYFLKFIYFLLKFLYAFFAVLLSSFVQTFHLIKLSFLWFFSFTGCYFIFFKFFFFFWLFILTFVQNILKLMNAIFSLIILFFWEYEYSSGRWYLYFFWNDWILFFIKWFGLYFNWVWNHIYQNIVKILCIGIFLLLSLCIVFGIFLSRFFHLNIEYLYLIIWYVKFRVFSFFLSWYNLFSLTRIFFVWFLFRDFLSIMNSLRLVRFNYSLFVYINVFFWSLLDPIYRASYELLEFFYYNELNNLLFFRDSNLGFRGYFFLFLEFFNYFCFFYFYSVWCVSLNSLFLSYLSLFRVLTIKNLFITRVIEHYELNVFDVDNRNFLLYNNVIFQELIMNVFYKFMNNLEKKFLGIGFIVGRKFWDYWFIILFKLRFRYYIDVLLEGLMPGVIGLGLFFNVYLLLCWLRSVIDLNVMYTYKELRDSLIFFDSLEALNYIYISNFSGWASVSEMMEGKGTLDDFEGDDDEIENLLESDYLYDYDLNLDYDTALDENFMYIEELSEASVMGNGISGGMDRYGSVASVELSKVISTIDLMDIGVIDTLLYKSVFYMFLIFIYIPWRILEWIFHILFDILCVYVFLYVYLVFRISLLMSFCVIFVGIFCSIGIVVYLLSFIKALLANIVKGLFNWNN